MTPAEIYLLVFLIGVIAGLRALTAPAVVAFAAYRNWINVHGTPLSFMSSIVALSIFVVLGIVELVSDQLPSTPPRTKGPGLIARILLGGLAGATLAGSQGAGAAIGIILGVAGALAGTFGGYQARTRLVKALNVPDVVIACIEDAIAIGGGLFIVSRF
ncbi:MAG: DUF4126 family protein [Candidatus Acidiferrales bacterium]